MTARAYEDEPVLAALAAAPVVPFTAEECALMAEVDPDEPRLSQEEFARVLASTSE